MRRGVAVLLLAAVLAVAGFTRSGAAFAPYRALWQAAERAVAGRTGETPGEAAARLWVEESQSAWDLAAPDDRDGLTWETVRDADSFVVMPLLALGAEPAADADDLVRRMVSRGSYMVIAGNGDAPAGMMELKYKDGQYACVMVAGPDAVPAAWRALLSCDRPSELPALYLYVLMEDYIVHPDNSLSMVTSGPGTLMGKAALESGSRVSWDRLAAVLPASMHDRKIDLVDYSTGFAWASGVGPAWAGPALAGCMGGVLALAAAFAVRGAARGRGGRHAGRRLSINPVIRAEP